MTPLDDMSKVTQCLALVVIVVVGVLLIFAVDRLRRNNDAKHADRRRHDA